MFTPQYVADDERRDDADTRAKMMSLDVNKMRKKIVHTFPKNKIINSKSLNSKSVTPDFGQMIGRSLGNS